VYIINILSIIDKFYESAYFRRGLIATAIILVTLFIIVLIIGLHDAKKSKEPKKNIEDELKDISFEDIPQMDNIKEDVTFEIPSLTKNLEDFKKSLEEEIEKEEMSSHADMVTEINTKEHESKKNKILDKEQIEDTNIISILPEGLEDEK